MTATPAEGRSGQPIPQWIQQPSARAAKPLYTKIAGRYREGGASGLTGFGRRYVGFHTHRLWLSLLARLHRLRPWGRTFRVGHRQYSYFFHPHNTTWRNERCVEIALALEVLGAWSGKRVLEVGNVLHNYVPNGHDVLDKYESADGVINQDIVDFSPSAPYDLIISVSTLEHVGWDEPDLDPEKVKTAFARLRSILAPGGRLWVSVPRGYHRYLDLYADHGDIPFTQLTYLRRNAKGRWREVPRAAAQGTPYGVGVQGAVAVMIGVLDAPSA